MREAPAFLGSHFVVGERREEQNMKENDKEKEQKEGRYRGKRTTIKSHRVWLARCCR